MKYKHTAVLAAVMVGSISLGAMAEKQALREKVFFLRSGNAGAELRIKEGNVTIGPLKSGQLIYGSTSGAFLGADGAVILKVTSGTNVISIQADQIFSPDSK